MQEVSAATNTAPDRLAAARAEWERWRTDQANYEHDAAHAVAALERLRETAAAEVLDNPARADEIAAERVRLAESAQVSAEAADLAAERAATAARNLVRREADALDSEIHAAEIEVARHNATTDNLRESLEAHTGTEWAERTPEQITRGLVDSGNFPGRIVFDPPRVQPLQAEVDRLRLQQNLLRAAADGADLPSLFPHVAFADLPESLHPVSGVLPQVGYPDPEAAAARLRAEAAAAAEAARVEAERLSRLIERSTEKMAALDAEGRSADAADLAEKIAGWTSDREDAAQRAFNLSAYLKGLTP